MNKISPVVLALGLVLLAACNPQAQATPLETVTKALDLLNKAPHYRIEARLVGQETRLYALEYLAPDRLHYFSQTTEAITIGATYYEKFMDGEWKVSATDPATLGDKLGKSDLSEVQEVKGPQDTLSYKGESCVLYSITLKDPAAPRWAMCIAKTGLPLIQGFEDSSGSINLYYDYTTPISIVAPI